MPKGADHGECVWRQSPSGVQENNGGVKGPNPPEAESLLSIFIEKRGQKLRIRI